MIRDIDAVDTYKLRRAVLRAGDPDAKADFPEDARPDAFHLGAFDEPQGIVGVASFFEEVSADRAGVVAWRLRGMAVAPSHQGRGIGNAIISEAVRRLRGRGAAVLWCNARDTAMAFYSRAGFVVVGDGFTTDETGLPHHRMLLDL